MLRIILVVAALLTCGGQVSAEVRIRSDNGGEVGSYLYRYALLRQSGQRVIIDGPCLSACTLVVAVVPKDRICITERATLGFHAPRVLTTSGALIMGNSRDVKFVMGLYPAPVRGWIQRKGGLKPNLMHLRGHELAAMYPKCT